MTILILLVSLLPLESLPKMGLEVMKWKDVALIDVPLLRSVYLCKVGGGKELEKKMHLS